MTIENISSQKCFGGWQNQYRHQSTTLNCDMQFSIYWPPQSNKGEKVPVLYWLSGLTCTDENFVQKAGAQQWAAELGIAIVTADTSPRGEGVANDDGYDLGQGAGFYVNATQSPWLDHFQMYDYIVHELPTLIESNFSVTGKRAISGHSMGGHGALTIALKNPGNYCSVSAFSPISNAMDCPWGVKALSAYLGDDRTQWEDHDASKLIEKATKDHFVPLLIEQGLDDSFLVEQLKPETLEKAAVISGYPLVVRRQEGYDHSYFFIASFIESHLRFHAKYLLG